MNALMAPTRPSRRHPDVLRPGDVAYLLEPGELGPTYRPVEVVKVNKATVAVRDAGGAVHRVSPEELSRRSAAGTPEPPSSRAAATLDAYRQATEDVEALRAAVFEAAGRRREALEGLVALGWSITDIAEATGLGRSRVSQILRGES